MANIDVTATAVQVTGTGTQKNAYTIQNLGPDAVYFGRDNTVDADTGVQLAKNAALNVPGSRAVWLVCDTDGTADVRFEQVT